MARRFTWRGGLLWLPTVMPWSEWMVVPSATRTGSMYREHGQLQLVSRRLMGSMSTSLGASQNAGPMYDSMRTTKMGSDSL
eukprot:2680193-Prymnesium_polylepis.1